MEIRAGKGRGGKGEDRQGIFTDQIILFNDRLSNKPFLIWLLTILPHLKYVAALPCNLSLIAFFHITVQGMVGSITSTLL